MKFKIGDKIQVEGGALQATVMENYSTEEDLYWVEWDNENKYWDLIYGHSCQKIKSPLEILLKALK